MHKSFILAGLVSLVSAGAQAPPPPEYLTMTKSGAVPIAPTPFPSPGIETLEGALVDGGPPLPGFIGPGGTAVVQTNLPQATYSAVLPSTNFDNLTGSTITGSITGRTAQNGTGVLFTVNFTGIPNLASYGPFVYHIHALPVTGGNCTTSMGHLDPTNRGELHACESLLPQTCQAGDLSGKHGNITTPSYSLSYLDLFLSTDPASPYFFGDKSIVIHARNATRLTCANFVRGAANGTSTGGASASGSGTAGGASPSSSAPLTTSSNGAMGAFDAGRMVFLALLSTVVFLLV